VNKPILSLKQQPQLKPQSGELKPSQPAPQPQATAPEPAPLKQQQPSEPAAAPAKPKEIKLLDVAEHFIHASMRDKAGIEITFVDGSTLAGHATGIGHYSINLRLDDGTEAVAFKVPMKWIKRTA
jgi:hypothetical protein